MICTRKQTAFSFFFFSLLNYQTCTQKTGVASNLQIFMNCCINISLMLEDSQKRIKIKYKRLQEIKVAGEAVDVLS